MTFRGKLIKDSCIRAPGAGLGLAPPGQAHLVEQDFAKLFRRADIEVFARQRADLFFKPGNLLRKGAGQARQHRPIDLDAGPLHLRKDGLQRPLERLVDSCHAFGRKARLQHSPEAHGRICFFARGFGGTRDLDTVERDCGFTRTQYLFLGEAGVAEQGAGTLCETMIGAPRV